MREILFRGKRVDNGTWAYGDLLHCDDEREINSESYGENGGYIIPETVGQYTGLTDKNGKKIFEGDILEGDLEDSLDPGAKWRSEIIWGKFGWNCKGNKISLPMDENDIREGEVIGNIHDNPELMGGNTHG